MLPKIIEKKWLREKLASLVKGILYTYRIVEGWMRPKQTVKRKNFYRSEQQNRPRIEYVTTLYILYPLL